jgi:hypothetical protein
MRQVSPINMVRGAADELLDFADGVVDVAVEFYFLRRETKRRPDGAPSIFSAIPTPLG